MKKIFYLSLAVAALLSVGCTKENFGNEAPNLNEVFDADGKAFMKLNIGLPTTPATKANDVFDDGIANEYTVENTILVLFSGPAGAAESDLVLRSAYNLGTGDWGNDASVQITTSRDFIAEIQKTGMASTDEIYALVILNHHDFFEVSNTGNDLIFDPANTAVSLKNKTFGFYQTLELNESNRRYDVNSFYMTNMPYANYAGNGAVNPGANSDFTVKNLYKVDQSKIKSNAADANSGAPAVTINVERALAKVSVDWVVPGGGFKTDTGLYPLTVLGWFIDNTNPTLYAVRKVEENPATAIRTVVPSALPSASPLWYFNYAGSVNKHRFVSASPVTGSEYRTFWAIDPNYDRNVAASELTNKGGQFVDNTIMVFNGQTLVSGNLRAKNSYYYCTENTFDVQRQSVSNTTRVVVATQFDLATIYASTPDAGMDYFYTIDVEPGKLYSPSQAIKYTANAIMQKVDVKTWLTDNFKPATYATADAVLTSGLFSFTATLPAGKQAGEVTIKVTPNPALTQDKLITETPAALAAALGQWDAAFQTKIDEFITSNYKVSKHTNGIAYYSALIRHFDDTETPWTNTGNMINTTTGVYDDNSNLYLGRYGVVRNNWYDINITGFRQIGSAVVPGVDPTTPDTPDDSVENFIKVKINITPWAKRTQNVTL